MLFVIGLLTSLTIPRFASSYKFRELAAQRSDIEDQLRELPRRVRLSAHPVALPENLKLTDLGDGLAPLRLPPGWVISIEPPLEVSLMGACSSSTVQLSYPEVPSAGMRYRVAELTCELSALVP